MSLPHALLGLISYQPSTGYELRTTFTESVQFFWSATLPQIYRTLNQMESQGWLTVRLNHRRVNRAGRFIPLQMRARGNLSNGSSHNR